MAVMEKRVLLGATRMHIQQPIVHIKPKHKNYRELLHLDRPKRKVVVVSDDENEDYFQKILRPPPNKPQTQSKLQLPNNSSPPTNPSPVTNPQLPPVENALPRKTVTRSSSRNTLRKEIYIDDESKVYKYNPPFDSTHLAFISSMNRQTNRRMSMRNMRPLHIQRKICSQRLVHVIKDGEHEYGMERRSGRVPRRTQTWRIPEEKRVVDRERLFKDAHQQEMFLRSLQ